MKDKATGKSKGFAFLAYEDQQSTLMAVDKYHFRTLWGILFFFISLFTL